MEYIFSSKKRGFCVVCGADITEHYNLNNIEFGCEEDLGNYYVYVPFQCPKCWNYGEDVYSYSVTNAC